MFVRDIRLEGKVAIITGGAGVLARAMADALLTAGGSVLLADVNGEAAHAAAAALRVRHPNVTSVACDITKAADCEGAVEAALETFHGLHILVNNAGRGPADVGRGPRTTSFKFWEADPDVWQQVIVTNVNGTFLMTRSVVPHLIRNTWGRVVNISTGLSMMSRREASPYGVSKLAIESETLIWAKDLEGTGVTVNSLQPGAAVDTPFFDEAGRKAMAARGGQPLQPDVLKAPIVWLASELANGVTGARFTGNLWDGSEPAAEAAAKARLPSVLVDLPT
jgi:3-oxoacyl-[acyl-carrier protein] reductase